MHIDEFLCRTQKDLRYFFVNIDMEFKKILNAFWFVRIAFKTVLAAVMWFMLK